jgi:hypothetical protein
MWELTWRQDRQQQQRERKLVEARRARVQQAAREACLLAQQPLHVRMRKGVARWLARAGAAVADVLKAPQVPGQPEQRSTLDPLWRPLWQRQCPGGWITVGC